jgi:hypothetical protein
MKNSASFLTDNNAPSGKQSSKMADLVIESRTGDVGPGFLFRQFFHKDAKLSKLMTREDPYHLHKTLGILSLINFIYRYGYVYLSHGNLGYNGSADNKHLQLLNWLTMLVHTCLALSSIIFRVPKKRINNKPMVIYEEYRQHAMVFTVRCLIVFTIATAFPNAATWWAPVGVMACHLLADRITSIHGVEGNTAVRATAKHQKLSPFYQVVGKLYSLYQFLAIGSHILPNARLSDLAFNAIIAIQSSAFMMTLYRKRIIRGRTHMVVYAACLLISGFHIVRLIGWWSCLLVTITFILRIKTPRKWSNKYLCWLIFLVMYNAKWLKETLLTTSNILSINEHDAFTGLVVAICLYITFKGERAIFKGGISALVDSGGGGSTSKQH